MMEKLTVESSCLTGCIKLLNHDVHRAMIDGKLDPGLAHTHKLGAAFYTNLTVRKALLTVHSLAGVWNHFGQEHA